jgi:hypothetical protein
MSHDESTTREKPVGVGGWLLVLILLLTIIGPLVGFLLLMSRIDYVRSDLALLLVLSNVISYGLTIRAGYLLAKHHQPSSVTSAIKLIWISGPLMVIVLAIFINSNYSYRYGVGVAEIVRPIVFAAFWTLYLLKSERVRRTYGCVGGHGKSLRELVGGALKSPQVSNFKAWWWAKSPVFRRWVFLYAIWFLSGLLFNALFEPYGYGMSHSELRHFMIVLFAPPAFLNIAYYAYVKFVK